ncbi:hypothetical protein MLP_52590 [Microlunatus phosphovorus NM-1]|uniref:Uncharacterized protein n=1 Tax=Microlunatus phosphovorus (strain ATCC 700054 / DSM 10555 / JCM 9379 / NBRC 101784 / NCIMB 13414 / VKM Ac-1990 / NM-1) TaxID=1032480 RepID=F5XIN5_MICPN|nr:hypothetical protein MLP_52590 [Microlunatus phosphovorus NM-1]
MMCSSSNSVPACPNGCCSPSIGSGRPLRPPASSPPALVALVHDEALVERFAAALVTVLPWVAFLPDTDRETFATEAADTLRACASIGRFTALADLIDNWRNTAEIWSDPSLAASLAAEVSTPLDQPV